ncbi:hypothetical protein HD806DRAFT_512033 [Xylariaceae sp. AK1471]|nr:hypothetical protein HD806DRAFT_512033 [Xylariaceae sp. AK1471]
MSPPARRLKSLACLRCRQRKQQCEEKRPCANCTRSGEECHEVAPKFSIYVPFALISHLDRDTRRVIVVYLV